ncbi:tRNA dihydrouridine synthase [Urbifossiella limnaea]|uniref:tRNA-dihydrouridine synthase C n=1 Tax=Urbifossiella limnaea TaxID=2528023 RepID=A0A517XRW3_9BACT|nr:tRNA-dihydrouridine synthase family protein [Urbifossiella limnaea]QDU20247.1 tRNA-dihydrouridine synthase C [Urbifossiella limnaea]
MLDPATPAVVLAPMEGVTDAPMRAALGESGAFTYAVAEFLRVAHTVPGRAVVRRHVPELLSGGRTPSGLPVQLQLLGGDPGRMAEAAAVAHAAGAAAIDLNFGCPAKTVNRHDGGAALLRDPPRVRAVVAAVRAAVPRGVPVSAKLRLGWDTPDAIDTVAAMAAEGGATWLTVHGRTRAAGYAPPAYWRPIGRVRERLGLPVVANGDIWTVADFRRCRDETGCQHFMLGRGALADPRLPRQVAAELGLAPAVPPDDANRPVDWAAELRRLVGWVSRFTPASPGGTVRRLKQWLAMAARHGGFAGFEVVKRVETLDDLLAAVVAVRSLGAERPPGSARTRHVRECLVGNDRC